MPNRVQYGFTWSRAFNGGKACPAGEEMQVASGFQGSVTGGGNVDLNRGDPVGLLSTGMIALSDGTEGTEIAVFGIIVGFRPYLEPSIGSNGALKPTNRLPGGTVYSNDEDRSIALVVPAAAGTWSVQADDNTTATTRAAYQALIGENFDHVLTEPTAPPNSAGAQLDMGSASTSSRQWRLWGIDLTVSNADFSDTNVALLVRINETQEAPFVTTGI